MSSSSTTVSRARRAEASDSSESSLGLFDISNGKFRLVNPPPPCPMPLTNYSGGDECLNIEAYFGKDFSQKGVEIAAECGIRESTVHAMLTNRADHMTAIALFKLGFNESYNSHKTVSGDDIGAGCYIRRADGKLANPPIGTLGCWVEINVKDHGWMKMALTNYHIVRHSLEGYTMNVKKVQVQVGTPLVHRGDMSDLVKGSELWTADHDGLKTKGTSKRQKMEHPTRLKRNFTVETLQRKIRSLERGGNPVPDDFRGELNDAVSFFDRGMQYFGSVFFASGFLNRTRSNGRLDWALIKPISDDRVGGIPCQTCRIGRLKVFCRRVPRRIRRKPKASDPLDTRPSKRRPCFKNGASTKCTVGKFEEIKADCTINEEKYMPGRNAEDRKSTEYMLLPLGGQPFGNRGDSGSVVWDEKGGVVGLLFTGQQPHGCNQEYSLVTPNEDVFESIKEGSQGNILDIRIL
ncbi:hypothetical protein CHGG_02433 [Chaetomium globosum CBS 148.51]|uniref:Uncharacterized protein n=1 Tax=Chaetomium globosum (strain ATCC 6205 / CBS 148.51 / DSM 1962 / NBRC 6347 / NRRL 1970) TaxID=306901 RepID=Q2HBH1_CHAGB|nr:uncharacterized protein CHGG_02433 [Chaetomium globosum CBS 148.51]EAQ90498.1 hypothetical protein CHGG_02433 [Chaetomium globosum CBS 148.51]